jgi:hypothetical protein
MLTLLFAPGTLLATVFVVVSIQFETEPHKPPKGFTQL